MEERLGSAVDRSDPGKEEIGRVGRAGTWCRCSVPRPWRGPKSHSKDAGPRPALIAPGMSPTQAEGSPRSAAPLGLEMRESPFQSPHSFLLPPLLPTSCLPSPLILQKTM